MRLVLTTSLLLILALPAFAGHPFGQPFTLPVGGSLEIGDAELTVGFVGILSESRCPEGVTCFWEGDAAADLWLQVAGDELQPFVLHTAWSYAQQSIVLGPYTVTMTLVTPTPNLEGPIDPESYEVSLVVIEGAVNAEEMPWGTAKAMYR